MADVAVEASSRHKKKPGEWDWGWKSASTVLGIASLALVVYGMCDTSYDTSRRNQVDMALEKLSATFSPSRKLRNDYILREKAEADLRKYLATAGGYLVVTAPIGYGKSTVIHHVLAEGGRTGVLLVNVKTKDAHPDIETLVV
jgi:hypothetical protein